MRNSLIKLLLALLISLLLLSCNSSILMNNGEILNPDDSGKASSSSSSSSSKFTGAAPSGVSATKSYYSDRIVVRWNSVTGADYYTVEKTEGLDSESDVKEASTSWKEVQQSFTGTTYTDSTNLEGGKYYGYRVTAHAFTDEIGTENTPKRKASSVAIGTVCASPTSLTASQGTSETYISLSWNTMPYVTTYKVFKSSSSVISGVAAELAATVPVGSGESMATYQYTPNQKEMGADVYFSIGSVSDLGDESEVGEVVRSGYTFKIGAPQQPKINSITKGQSANEITIKFSSNDAASIAGYVIKRSASGLAESTVYDYADGETLESTGSGSDTVFTFTDSDVKPNVEYTYSIIAQNEVGNSIAATGTGYLLSPVKNLKLVAVNENNGEKLGYRLKFDLPVGHGDTDSAKTAYEYTITKTFKSGAKATETEIISEAGIEEYLANEEKCFTAFAKNPTTAEENAELKKVTITVSNTSNVSAEPVDSNEIPNIPKPVTKMGGTQNNKPESGDVYNANGVYPVHVTWETEQTGTVTLYRKGSDGKTVSFKVNAANGSYDDESTSPLIMYTYWIDDTDELGRHLEGGNQKADGCYGSLDIEFFGNIFQSVCLKPWDKQKYVPSDRKTYWKNTEIAKAIAKGNSSSLSTQMGALIDSTATDQYGGKIAYSASMEGMGGQIYFTYTDFGESEYMKLTGAYEMHVNASGTGSTTSSTGGLFVTGMYTGVFGLGSMEVKSKAFSGSYTVTYTYSDGSVKDDVKLKINSDGDCEKE